MYKSLPLLKVALLTIVFGIITYTSSASAECKNALSMRDFEDIKNAHQQIVLGPMDLMRYGKGISLVYIPLDRFGDNELNEFFLDLDECAQSSRLERLKFADGIYRYSDDEKRLFIENIKRMQSPFQFIHEFTEEHIVFNDLKLSCMKLMDSSNAYVSAKQPNGLLLGKPLSAYENSDFEKIRNKINQCLGLVRATYVGFSLNKGAFEASLLHISNTVNSWESERNLLSAMIDSAQKEKERKESFSYVGREWISEFGDKVGKAIIFIGILIIAIAGSGVVKRDKRFKTGRVNNEDDAPWVVKLGTSGFAVAMIGGAIMLIASWIAPV